VCCKFAEVRDHIDFYTEFMNLITELNLNPSESSQQIRLVVVEVKNMFAGFDALKPEDEER